MQDCLFCYKPLGDKESCLCLGVFVARERDNYKKELEYTKAKLVDTQTRLGIADMVLRADEPIIMELQAQVNGLLKYAKHKPTCEMRNIDDAIFNGRKPTCNCGFAEFEVEV